MKKFVWLIFLIVFIGVGYLIINNKKSIDNNINELDYIEDIYGSITNYYIYGNHFNVEGNINLHGNFSLILKNGDDEDEFDIITSTNDNMLNFKTSDKINGGINLDRLKQGNWYLLLKDNDTFSIKRIGKFKYMGILKSTKSSHYIVEVFKYI